MNLQENIKLKEIIKIILKEEFLNESDPKTGTGKKPKGSSRRLYTDENPKDTVTVKFRTKEDIVDTLNKDSFKSKSHKRQSQIINLIHQRVRVAYQNSKDPETKKRLKRGLDYVENKKENSKKKTERLNKLNEEGADTSWTDIDKQTITLQDILELTKDIKIQNFPTKELALIVLNWDNNPEEIERISQVEISSQYPILIMVDEQGKIQWILDGNHRAQKALSAKVKTIPAKLIKPSDLNSKARKILLNIIDEHVNSQKEDINNKYNLAGNCVTGLDDPYFQRNVCDDATEMAGIVDEDSNEFLTSEEFVKKVNWDKNILGIADDNMFEFAYNEYKDIYWAYNIEDDVHFFFIEDRIN